VSGGVDVRTEGARGLPAGGAGSGETGSRQTSVSLILILVMITLGKIAKKRTLGLRSSEQIVQRKNVLSLMIMIVDYEMQFADHKVGGWGPKNGIVIYTDNIAKYPKIVLCHGSSSYWYRR
jgi:hypothetical protein